MIHSHGFQKLISLRLSFFLRSVQDMDWSFDDIPDDRQVREEIEVLEDGADLQSYGCLSRRCIQFGR